ncbi:hypothetical protein CHUAL_013353 [Chamberlinius hualienensis]
MGCRQAWCLVIFLWIWISVTNARKYNIRQLCDIQDGSVRISLEQGYYVQLNIEVDLEGPGTNCEIIIQTTHKDDGLLIYFEHFDFVGSNSATVFRSQACGASMLRMMDGEIQYVSSCIGTGLGDAPSMATYSSLGAVRLQLLPANMTSLSRIKPADIKQATVPSHTSPITFSVIATASQKVMVSEECPSGCCREPYTFKCPLLNYCIDVKLMCNNVTNCGPKTGTSGDENGVHCRTIVSEEGSEDINKEVETDDPETDDTKTSNDFPQNGWSEGTEGDFSDIGYTEVPQAFYTRVELVCGIVSIALFCLAGIGVLVCKVRTNGPQTRSRSNSARRDSGQSAVYAINETLSNNTSADVGILSQNQYSMSVASTRNIPDSPNTTISSLSETNEPGSSRGGSETNLSVGATTVITCKPKRFAIDCEYCRTFDNDGDSSYNVYIMDMDGKLHYPPCPKSIFPAPPSYDSLFPKPFGYLNHHHHHN